MLTMDNIQNTSFKLSRVPYLSPLHGSINLRLRCTMEVNIVFQGFIVSASLVIITETTVL